MPRPYSMQRRAASAAQTRQRILDAAARLVVERRSTDISIADIAATADIAPRTLYNHFPTIDDLMGETMAQMTLEFTAVEPGTARPDEPPIDAIRRIVGDWFRQLESHAELLEALLNIRESPAFAAALDAARMERRSRMRALTEIGGSRSAKELERITSIAYALTGFAAWQVLVREEGRTTDEAAEMVACTIAELLGYPSEDTPAP